MKSLKYRLDSIGFLLVRLLDLIIILPAWLCLAPLMVVIAAFIKLSTSDKIFFYQDRPGLHGKPFRLVKFRTMNDARDTAGNLLPDADRLTDFGRFLRTTSLDELPEMINIIKGDMSIVGPRPLLMQYLERYSPSQARRHDVKPGLTGWAQINGRNAINWEEKFDLDLWYVENRSLWLDMKIILLTIKKVLQREGISQAGHATMPEFGL